MNTSLPTAFAVAVLFTGARVGQAQVESPDSLRRAVDRLFAAWDTPTSPGCGILVGRDDVVLYERGYGMANLEYGTAITPASVFHVGSVTKQFTAMAVLQLVQRGQVSLDEDIRRYLPELPEYASRVTVRHLLTHTSGLRNGWDVDYLLEASDPSPGQALTRFARLRALNAAPGTQYRYLNFGYVLLGLIAERVTGRSLGAFAEANIFRPLGMTQSFYHDDARRIVPNRAAGYDQDGRGGWRIAVDSWTGGASGSTGLYTTARDLLTWQRNFDDVRVGDPALLAAMQAPNVLLGGDTSWAGSTGYYGMGAQVGSYRGLPIVGHSGGDPGYTARMMRFPAQRLAIIVLCNQRSASATALAFRVADVYLAGLLAPPPPPPPTVSLSRSDLAGRTGLFLDRSTGLFIRVITRDDRLIPIARGDTAPAFVPLGADRFLGPQGVLYEYVRPASGARPDLHATLPGGAREVFEQVEELGASRQTLTAYAGAYHSVELQTTYTLVARDSDLVVRIRGRSERILRPVFRDGFQGAGLGLVTFVRDSSGAVTGFTSNREDVRGLRFERSSPWLR